MALNQAEFNGILVDSFTRLFRAPMEASYANLTDEQKAETDAAIAETAAAWADDLAPVITTYIQSADITGVDSAGTTDLVTGAVTVSQNNTVNPN